VDAVDLDPKMILRAQRRLARYGPSVRLAQGSATDLAHAFSAFGGGTDTGYDFAIIHHIPDWQGAVAEVARVLKPGGRFFFDEVTAAALARPSYRLLFDHPTENRFTAGQFLAALSLHGLHVADRWKTRIGSDYVLGVAHRE
jgi:ubiquinone/menaquinone biosynthesis C-methylase UbiE